MKSYSTTNKASNDSFENSEPIAVTIDGDTFTFHPPTSTQFFYFLSTQSRDNDEGERARGIRLFIDGLLDVEDRRLLERRMTDRGDSLTFDFMQDILEDLMEEWSDRPTEAPSASTSSRKRTGAGSTARQRSMAAPS